MDDLISRNKLQQNRPEWLNENCVGREEHNKGWNACNEMWLKTIAEQPTVEAVPKSYVDQIRWERDVAINQLNEIGCGFGQKMDEVKKKLEAVPVVHGEWIPERIFAIPRDEGSGIDAFKCSVCGNIEVEKHPFCNCGADMRKKV